MFSDSQIAKQFSCGKTKCTYLMCFGVAPYFKEVLCKTLSELDQIFCQFNESYNQVVKKSQMGLHVRYWDSSLEMVKTRYYNSKFLGKAGAVNIIINFRKCINGLEEGTMHC